MPTNTPQARYWLLTIPENDYTPSLPNDANYIRGQLESGETTSYRHWQILVAFKKKKRLAGVKSIFGTTCHAEPGRSNAARKYVWKEDTRINGTQFEYGHFATQRNCPEDWEKIWDACKCGRTMDIPADIRVKHYRTIKQIEKDFLTPIGMEREIIVFWGDAGTGKSRRAWEEAGLGAYPKDPCTKVCCSSNSPSHTLTIPTVLGRLRWP